MNPESESLRDWLCICQKNIHTYIIYSENGYRNHKSQLQNDAVIICE